MMLDMLLMLDARSSQKDISKPARMGDIPIEPEHHVYSGLELSNNISTHSITCFMHLAFDMGPNLQVTWLKWSKLEVFGKYGRMLLCSWKYMV